MAKDSCIDLKMHPVCIEVIHDKPDEGLYGLDKQVHEAPLTLNSDVGKNRPSTPSTETASASSDVTRKELAAYPKETPSINSKGSAFGKVAKAVEKTDNAVKVGTEGVRVIAGSRAFRHYNWMSGVVGTNRNGNLCGMVKSAKARVIHLLTEVEDGGEIPRDIEPVIDEVKRYRGYLTIASWAAGILAELPRIRGVVSSRESHERKGAQLAGIAWTVTQRVYAGAVPAGTHSIYRAMEGLSMIGGLIYTRSFNDAARYGQVFRTADTLVNTTFETITESENQWWLIKTVASPRTKLAPILKKGLQSLASAKDGLKHAFH